eukprot:scaffold2164_cov106-Cylindrotheca_fusiformis.AAC.14
MKGQLWVFSFFDHSHPAKQVVQRQQSNVRHAGLPTHNHSSLCDRYLMEQGEEVDRVGCLEALSEYRSVTALVGY